MFNICSFGNPGVFEVWMVGLDDYGPFFSPESEEVCPVLTEIQPGPERPSNKRPSIRRLGFIQALVHHSVDRGPSGTAAGALQLTFRLFHLFLGD